MMHVQVKLENSHSILRVEMAGSQEPRGLQSESRSRPHCGEGAAAIGVEMWCEVNCRECRR